MFSQLSVGYAYHAHPQDMHTPLGMHAPLGMYAPPRRIPRDALNERAVRIILECILVSLMFHYFHTFKLKNFPATLQLMQTESLSFWY